MKKLILAAALAVAATATVAKAHDMDDRADYLRRLEKERGLHGPSIFGSIAPLDATVQVRGDRAKIAQALATATERKLGRRWVPTALKIAKVESGFNCGAVGPRLRGGDHAMGLGQVRIGSARALGYAGPAHALRSCDTGIEMMLAHMQRCEQSGASTDELMARCHVAGWGSLSRRLNKGAERYARKYQHMVRNAGRVQYAMR